MILRHPRLAIEARRNHIPIIIDWSRRRRWQRDRFVLPPVGIVEDERVSSFAGYHFDEVTLKLLERVLDEACQQRSVHARTWDGAIRQLYARRIFSRAAAGERDPASLLRYALLSSPASSD